MKKRILYTVLLAAIVAEAARIVEEMLLEDVNEQVK